MDTILMIGATGNIGREVLPQLRQRGVPVRVLMPNSDKGAQMAQPGVEVAYGKVDQPDSLAAALAGISRVYVELPVGRNAQAALAQVLTAAQHAGVPFILRPSGLGAAPDSPSAILREQWALEQQVAASGLAYTHLRPNYFMQSLLDGPAVGVREGGVLAVPMGSTAYSIVDKRDIGAVAAAVLAAGGHDGQTYAITGPAALTFTECASQLSAALQKPVRYINPPPQQAAQAMQAQGVPEALVRDLLELWAALAAGPGSAVTDTVALLTGRPATPFRQFVTDHLAAFQAG